MHPDIKKIILTEEEIQEMVSEVANRINEDYKGKELLVVGILKGSVIFMSDLVKRINVPLQMDFMLVSSYGLDSESSGDVKTLMDISANPRDRHILIVEDIIDTGRTIKTIMDLFSTRGAASVKTVALLDKVDRREIEFDVDYIGTEVPDEFLVGYGLDFAEKHRNFPFVAALKEEAYL